MDSTILVALTSVLIAAITAAGGIIVAIITSKKESTNSAEMAMKSTMDQRLTLRDEQIEVLRRRVANRDETIQLLREELTEIRKSKDV